MYITNYLRAMVCRSTKAAYALAVNDIKYIPFAQKMVAVKNTAAYYDVQCGKMNTQRVMARRLKLNKYDFLLRNLAFVQPNDNNNSENNLLCYPNHIPRLGVKSINSNSHPYFLPAAPFPQEISISGIKPRTPTL
ncbi:hypothetical protein [Vagococcus sp. WN89Y]|uniref:hypothetical protein n=1 Tax=Vagococcus sp. WN89Y TaxID=3457258 RepID=UPI003FCEC244